MSETFRNLDPRELQHTLLQFMGENMGELKQLESNLIAKNQTLQGMTLQPEAVLRSIPQPQPQPVIQPQPVVVQQPVIVQQPAAVTEVCQPIQQIEEVDDTSQMVFEFVEELKKTPSITEKILFTANKVDVIESLLIKIDHKLGMLLEKSDTLKKKKREVA
jgi:hypothetical protein